MKRAATLIGISCLLALVLTTRSSFAQPSLSNNSSPALNLSKEANGNLTAMLKELTDEFRKLRSEINKERLETQDARLLQLQLERGRLETDQLRLQEDERSLSHEIDELDEQLTQSALEPEDQADLTTTRAELVGAGQQKLQARSHTLSQQLAELTERLHKEEDQRRKLVSTAAGLTTEDNESATSTPLAQPILELRRLSVDLHQLQLDNLGVKISQLEYELQRTRAQQKQLQDQEQTLNREIFEMTKYQTESSLSTEERAKLEASKAMMTQGEQDRLRAELRPLAQGQSLLITLLEQAKKHREDLIMRIKELNQP
jgi:hypothetical protein